MPDRVAGIPVDGEGIGRRGDRRTRFIYVGDWKNRGAKGFLRINTEGSQAGFRSYDSDTTLIEPLRRANREKTLALSRGNANVA